jgi:hypothetical protein
MSLFPEYDETYTVYEYTVPTGWVAPSWTLIGEVVGRIEPVAGNEEILNNQDYQGVTEILFMDLDYEGIVKPDHYLVDPRGIVYQNRGIPETWRNLIPYVMCKLERSQSPVEIPVST